MRQSVNGHHPGLRAKHNEAAALVSQMTLDEKAGFCSGSDFWHLEGCERLDVTSIMVTDGPHGLRKQDASVDHAGLHKSIPATCFPTACALASSWNTDLLKQVGEALGREAAAEDVTVLLGPGVNIKRHPLCGRNFEYYSEDPLLTGQLAAAFINGVQSQGVGTSIKHYALNNQEYRRMQVDVIADERSIREIYLRGFEIAIKTAQPWTVMCSYNRINGTYASEHDWLLNQVLRDEWGFEGLVVTDWGAANDRVKGLAAGLDLEMPASGGVNDQRIKDSVGAGDLLEARLDLAVTRLVSLGLLGGELTGRSQEVDWQAHHNLARQAAAESAVLLKNDKKLLPLNKGSKIAVIGEFAKQPRYQGAGSSQVNPQQLDNAYDALAAFLGEAPAYAPGYYLTSRVKGSLPDQAEGSLQSGAEGSSQSQAEGSLQSGAEGSTPLTEEQLIAEAVALAHEVEVVVLFAGLPAIYESEGFDRANMQMPAQHNRLIEAVCNANPNTAVLLFNGGPVELPWLHQVAAILEMYLPGEAGGSAAVDLIYGQANPSGKLAETFPRQLDDVPAHQWFPGDGRQVQYREGLHVGYRYFDEAAEQVLFPFGHGLGYTQFGYADLQVDEQEGQLNCQLALTNQGGLAGAEVVQLYIHKVGSEVWRPQQELKAFAKVMLAPGETKRVMLTVDIDDLAIYDKWQDRWEVKPGEDDFSWIGQGAWLVEPGEYEIRVAASSQDIRLRQSVQLAGSQGLLSDAIRRVTGPTINQGRLQVDDETFAAMLDRPLPEVEPVRPYHLNTSLGDLGGSWVGRLLMKRAMKRFRRNFNVDNAGDRGKEDPAIKMFEEMTKTMPLRTMVLFSQGKLSFRMLALLLALMNHQYLEVLRLLLGGREKWQ